MTRNLYMAFAASMLMAASGCLGGYQPGSPGTPANNAGSGGTGGGGGVASGGVDAGAGGGGGMQAPPPSNAKPMFDANVAPILMAKCSMAACHGGTAANPPPFAAGPASTLYATVLNYATVLVNGDFDPTKSEILLMIEPGNHNGATYSQTDITNITNWEQAEQSARANTDGGTVVSPADALLAKFSGCMTLTEFTSANFAPTWAQKTSTSGACQQCHTDGGNGMLANQDPPTMFSRLMQKSPFGGYFLQDYFTVDTTDPANPKMVTNTALLMQMGMGYAQHPTFTTATNDNAMTVLQSYFTTVMGHMTAGTCGPSQLAP